MRERSRSSTYLACGVMVVLLLALTSLFVGVSDIPLAALLPWTDHAAARETLFISRLPRTMAIILSGAAMAVGGLIMQMLARNKFVEPSTVGTVEAASLGILTVTMMAPGASLMTKMVVASIFALGGTAIFMRVLGYMPMRSTLVVPLVGIMIGSVIGAVTTFFAYRNDLLQILNTWMTGDFSGILQGRYELLWVVGALTVVAYAAADRFTVAGLGQDFTTNLGLSYRTVMRLGLVIVSIVSAVVVVTVGAIPFLGLVVPNVVSIFLGDNVRRAIPGSPSWGLLSSWPATSSGGSSASRTRSRSVSSSVPSARRCSCICCSEEALMLLERTRAMRHRIGPPQRLVLLSILAMAVVVVFLTIDVNGYWDFILPRRITKLTAMVLMAFSVAMSTVLFQTITSNRILTPSLMGFDSLCILLQTLMVFVFSSRGLLAIDERLRFGFEVVLMTACATALFSWLFGSGRYSLHLLLLVGIVFGTLFRSLSSFLQRVIDPSEFVILQDRFFASFNAVPEDLLLVSIVLIGAVSTVVVRMINVLDVLALGREHATNLGVDHRRAVMVLLVLIAVMVSVSTALVGPITFFGLLVANLAYIVAGTNRHAFTIPVAALIAIITLVGGQLVVERIFDFDTSLSVIIEFVGGLVFIGLLIRSTRGATR